MGAYGAVAPCHGKPRTAAQIRRRLYGQSGRLSNGICRGEKALRGPRRNFGCGAVISDSCKFSAGRPYVLGLDLGVASIGWAAIEHTVDEEDRPIAPCGLLGAGVRIFDAGLDDFDRDGKGVPRGEARRLARQRRRQVDRRARRNAALFNFAAETGSNGPETTSIASETKSNGTETRSIAAKPRSNRSNTTPIAADTGSNGSVRASITMDLGSNINGRARRPAP